jgi:large conductance mechanosensitive channel
MFKQFMEFLKSYNVIGLALAVVIGGKANALAGSLVNDLVTPLLLQPALRAAGVENVAALNAGGIFYGKILAAGLDFLLMALLVFLFARLVLKEEKVAQR